MKSLDLSALMKNKYVWLVAALGLAIAAVVRPAWLALAVGIAGGIVLYLAMCYIFKIESFKQLLNIVKSSHNG